LKTEYRSIIKAICLVALCYLVNGPDRAFKQAYSSTNKSQTRLFSLA